MDKEYILSSPNFEGELTFYYGTDKFIKTFKMDATFTEEQWTFLAKNFPFTLDCLQDLKKKSKTLILREVLMEVSFDMFWERYDYKKDKPEAIAKWGKLTRADKQEAYNYIPQYNRELGALAKKYAKTYLNTRPWIK